MAGIDKVLETARSSETLAMILVKRRSAVAQEWSISIDRDEALIIDALPDDMLRTVVNQYDPARKQGECNTLLALVAKAATSEGFLEELIELRSAIGEEYGLEIPQHERKLIDSVPANILRVMVRAMQNRKPKWLSVVAKIGIAAAIGLMGLMWCGGSSIGQVFGNRPGQTLDDFFRQEKLFAQMVHSKLEGRERSEIINDLEMEFAIKIFLSPDVHMNAHEQVTIPSGTLKEVIERLFSAEKRSIFYANDKVMIE